MSRHDPEPRRERGFFDPVVRPDEYFREEFPDGDIWTAIAVVVGVGIVILAGMTVVLGLLVADSPNASFGGAVMLIVLVAAGLGITLGMAITWVVVGGLLHLGTWFVDGTGEFDDTLVVAAWAMIPTAIQMLIGLTLAYNTLSGAGSLEEANVMIQRVQSRGGYGTATSLALGLPFTAWKAYIWAHGLHHARNVDFRDAVSVSFVVAVLLIAYSLVG